MNTDWRRKKGHRYAGQRSANENTGFTYTKAPDNRNPPSPVTKIREEYGEDDSLFRRLKMLIAILETQSFVDLSPLNIRAETAQQIKNEINHNLPLEIAMELWSSADKIVEGLQHYMLPEKLKGFLEDIKSRIGAFERVYKRCEIPRFLMKYYEIELIKNKFKTDKEGR